MDVGFDGRAAKPALAKPDKALVRVDAYPDQGSAGLQSDSLNFGDFQDSISSVLCRREHCGWRPLSTTLRTVFERKTCASQLDRSSEGSKRRRRIGSKGVKSLIRVTPSPISSAKASPVAGALRMPQTLWPVAT